MRFLHISLISALLYLLPAALFAAGDSLIISITPDHADYMYHVGDSAAFKIELGGLKTKAAPKVLRYRFTRDKTSLITEGELAADKAGLVLKQSADQPCIMRLDLELKVGEQTARKATAVGIDPESIRSTNTPAPDYFRFWAQGIAELLRVPMDAQEEQIKEDKVPGGKRYRVSLANIEGSRFYGWLSVPAGQGPFPAVVYIPGAPGRVYEFMTGTHPDYAENGLLVFAINIHGIELDRDSVFYQSLLDRIPGGFSSLGEDDPYRYYYRRVVLGALRAFDYLRTRPDVDTSRLAVAGSSQGGGLSLLVASLEKRLKAAAFEVPAMCDQTGVFYGRPTGWPHMLDRDSGSDERVVRTSRYYDAALAARFVRAPCMFTVSLLDESCPPTTVYTAYNNAKEPKEIFVFPNTTHPGSFTAERDLVCIKWLKKTLGEGK